MVNSQQTPSVVVACGMKQRAQRRQCVCWCDSRWTSGFTVVHVLKFLDVPAVIEATHGSLHASRLCVKVRTHPAVNLPTSQARVNLSGSFLF